MILYAFPIRLEHMRGFSASLSMLFSGGVKVIENNCINNLHYLIIFDLITFNGLRPVIHQLTRVKTWKTYILKTAIKIDEII